MLSKDRSKLPAKYLAGTLVEITIESCILRRQPTSCGLLVILGVAAARRIPIFFGSPGRHIRDSSHAQDTRAGMTGETIMWQNRCNYLLQSPIEETYTSVYVFSVYTERWLAGVLDFRK
jgi:hypothetical protein